LDSYFKHSVTILEGWLSHLFSSQAQGTGFAQATKKGSDTSSEVLQKVFQRVCLEDAKLLAEFLNKVFNNLNWAITEFGVCAKEVLVEQSYL
jgi:hypothetical protein